MKTVLDCVAHWEQTDPDRAYLHQPMGGGAEKVWTFRQAAQDARCMAAYLNSLGLPPGSQIAIWSKNSAHWVLADWAIAMAGHVSVPLYPALNPDTVRYILEHSESKAVFVGKLDPIWDEARLKAAIPPGVVRIGMPLAAPGAHESWDEVLARTEPVADFAPRAPADLATIIYTSGSTGRPKGVMLTFGAIMAATVGCAEVVKTRATDRMLSYLPMAHVMERWLIASCSIHAGCQVFFAETIDTFPRDLQRAKPTLFVSMPRLWLKFQLGVFQKLDPKRLERLLKIPILRGLIKKKILRGLGLDHVRFAGSGSAPASQELIAWYRGLGLELLEGYGMTENFGYSHLTRPGQARPGTVGTPYPEVECKLGPDGEVLVKSPAMMAGYFKLPEETRLAFTADGFLKTGDRGELGEGGRLRLTGRTKELFKTSKGKYVAPAPLESLILENPAIELACVAGVGQAQPHAMVALSPAASAKVRAGQRAEVEQTLKHLLARVNQSVETFERLQFIAVVDGEWTAENGMLTPTLKVMRQRVELAYAPHVEGWYAAGAEVVWHEASPLRAVVS
jgi:long-chain acyl-CoA synthetase